jgi:hypothetical protein
MAEHGIRRILRDQYPCDLGLGGCGSSAGVPCLSRNGTLTQPHAARWNAYWNAHGISMPRGSAPRGTGPDPDLQLALAKIDKAWQLHSEAGVLIGEATEILICRVSGG